MQTAAMCVQVAEGIYQARLPLPFALNLVNCYLLREDDGWTILDTGIHTAAGEAAWHQVFAELKMRPRDIRQIVLTHVHPDHFGMAGWLQDLCRADGAVPPVLMSPDEARMAQITWGSEGRQALFDTFLTACGMPPEMVSPVGQGIVSTRAMTLPHPSLVETVEPGRMVMLGRRCFQAIHAPGHSDGQLIFYDADDGLLLCGDHVLMKITPNIGLWPDTEPDPLGRFLGSLHALKSLEVRLALPGHKTLIYEWRARVIELLKHHDTRLERTLAVVNNAGQDGLTVYDASLQVFDIGQFSHHEWRFAMVETNAHLDYLTLRGRLRREDDGGGQWRFYRV